MQPVDLYIRELLFEYDCVIVPGLGGFLAQARPSLLLRDKRRIYPPSRIVTFNAMLVHDDGLLASCIAREEKTAYRDALQKIEAYVSACKNLLASGQSVKIEGIGNLSITPEKSIVFYPLADANFAGYTFGLDSIYLHPAEIKEPLKRTDKKPVDRAPRAIRKSPASVKWTLSVALPVIVFLLYGIIFPVSFQRLYMNYSGIITDVFINKTQPSPAKTVEMKQEPVEVPVVSLIVEPAVVIQDEPAGPSKPMVKSQAGPVIGKKFYIIGGCFESHENAYKFLSELKNRGFEAEEAGTNQRGHLRISYKSFPGRQEALIYLDEIKARENPAAWLLKY
jgi:hypothetical protein